MLSISKRKVQFHYELKIQHFLYLFKMASQIVLVVTSRVHYAPQLNQIELHSSLFFYLYLPKYCRCRKLNQRLDFKT